MSYKISQEAIVAVDFISTQIYGPSPSLYNYDIFKQKAEKMMAYGIPKEKLVLGMPFIGASHIRGKTTIAYLDFVNAVLSNALNDTFVYNGDTYNA